MDVTHGFSVDETISTRPAHPSGRLGEAERVKGKRATMGKELKKGVSVQVCLIQQLNWPVIVTVTVLST